MTKAASASSTTVPTAGSDRNESSTDHTAADPCGFEATIHTCEIPFTVRLGSADLRDSDDIEVRVCFEFTPSLPHDGVSVIHARQISPGPSYEAVYWYDQTMTEQVDESVQMDRDGVYEALCAVAVRERNSAAWRQARAMERIAERAVSGSPIVNDDLPF